jgi:hypothetical protein
MLRARPSGELGAPYTVTYLVPGPDTDSFTIVQQVYPYAEGGPVTFVEPGQAVFDTTASGGWYRAGPELKPSSSPQASRRSLPARRPATTRSRPSRSRALCSSRSRPGSGLRSWRGGAPARRPPEGYIRKTPNVVSATGAFAAAARPSASTRRVSRGSMIPSSQRRAVE